MESLYTTKDFYLAASLVARGHEVVSSNKENNAVLWDFSDTPKLQKDIEQFMGGQLEVRVVDYIGAQKILKSYFKTY